MNVEGKDIEKLNSRISEVWDNNVSIRAKDLEKGTDYSYTQIIKPWVCAEVLKYSGEESHILDIGCGCGYLTNAIYVQGRHNITGIDLSPASIAYAQKRYPNIEFANQDIYSVSLAQKYNMCLAVMVLNNVPSLNAFFKNVANVLKRDGKMIMVIPHPFFWPIKHLDVKSFPYAKEGAYLFRFSTKGRKDYSASVTYFHRSLEQYINAISKNGYKILCCKELVEMAEDETPDILGFVLQRC